MALEPAAKRGDTIAQVTLAKAYLTGDNLPKDVTQASKWFRQAAEKGNTEGAFFLGLLTMQGAGVEKDFPEALKWLRKSAEQGFTKAQNALGNIYSEGLGDMKPDWKEALLWYRKAAEQGDIDAQRNPIWPQPAGPWPQKLPARKQASSARTSRCRTVRQFDHQSA